MNRIDRLSAIIIQLQSRKTVRAQDIADRYQISLRTVYRDIRSLEEAGIPIIGEAGVGYCLVEGYRLPPVMFTKEEATAFLTAEKLVSRLTDAANGSCFTSALDKVRAVLKTTEKDYLEHIDDKIAVIKSSRPLQIVAQANPLQIILNAIAGQQVLELHYFSYYRQEETQRRIEPVGVFYLDHYWHLIAWCRERGAYRDFRFDRVRYIAAGEELFTTQHPPFKSFIDNQYKDMKLEDVTILIDAEAALHLGEQKYYQGYVSENVTDQGIEMQFLTMSVEGFARWFMSIADYAIILHSDPLKIRVKTLLAAILNKMENSEAC